jgi:hypothetical protein
MANKPKEAENQLSQAQRTLISRARNVGTSSMAVPLGDGACCYLCAAIIHDLGLIAEFPEIPKTIPAFFDTYPVTSLDLPGLDFEALATKLFVGVRDADTYFACLAQLHKSRLKFEQILRRQSFATFDQVGPRCLLQFGNVNPQALAAMLVWRKWLYDLDNRAAQETGYLFEPILANAVGGVPASAARSPVKRRADRGKGRQVDCIKGKRAYEFKMRVTIAASGQGRWAEELAFPLDCKGSGYKPVLVCFDPTPNPKLEELVRAFENAGGETFVGDAAWNHLEEQAGDVMSRFVERYVRAPVATVMKALPDNLGAFSVSTDDGGNVIFEISGSRLVIERSPSDLEINDEEMPDDVDE